MSEMTEHPGNMLERGASVVRSLNLTNVLIVALLVIVAVPSYFAYRFMTDAAFRGEFMSSAVDPRKVRAMRGAGRRIVTAASRGTAS